LIRSCPELAGYVRPGPAGSDTIDFADPEAVTTLNRALLALHYGVPHWHLPTGALCPPIPGRAEYIHHLADLLAEETRGAPPRGPGVAILDLGTSANCVYPIIGVSEYDWRFVGSDIDAASLAWARKIVAANPSLTGRIELRLQSTPAATFVGVVRPGERFAASMCNPPFHASRAEAMAGTLRKLKNLAGAKPPSAVLNFGGRSNELWCRGGEAGFIRRMILESAAHPDLCRWFTTLVSSRDSLPGIQRTLETVRASAVRVIDLAHGQKKSRIVAWRFTPPV
jgi:23S rRNA (adenine1618-N6)-methyltransferase